MTDQDLLQRYAESGSEEAFAELVSHHGEWVYSAAKRMVRRDDWAEDVGQAVFLLLARRGAKLKPAKLNAWLFNVTRYCSLNLLRAEKRRQKWEKEAAIMNRETCEADPETTWQSIEPILEETVHRLPAGDRDAVLLRFYQRKSMAEIGVALGVTEDAARKRVGKAVGRLRAILSARGAVVPAAAIAASILVERTTHAAPAGMVAGFASGKASAAASQIATGVNQMLIAFKIKAVAALILLALIPSGAWLALHTAAAGQIVAPAANRPPSAIAASTQPADALADDGALSPFFNSYTPIIACANVSKVDWNTLQEQSQTVLLGAAGPDEVLRKLIERETADMSDHLRHIFDSLGRSGASRIYVVIAGPPGAVSGFFALPLAPNSNVELLDAAIKRPGMDAPGGRLRLYGAKQSPAVLLQQMEAAESRPFLLEGLSAGPEQAIRVVTVPEVIGHSGSIGKMLGLSGAIDPLWKTVKWIRVGIDTAPSLTASVTVGCRDAETATAFAGLLTRQFAGLKDAGRDDELESIVAVPLGNVKPAASDDMVKFTLDATVTADMFAFWYWYDIQDGGKLTK